MRRTVLVAVGDVDRRAIIAAHYALTLRTEACEAVHVAVDPQAALDVCDQWQAASFAPFPLRTLPDHGGVAATLADEVAALRDAGFDEVVVVAGELSMPRLRRYVLHDRTAAAIRRAVNGIPGAFAVLLPVAVDHPRTGSLRSR